MTTYTPSGTLSDGLLLGQNGSFINIKTILIKWQQNKSIINKVDTDLASNSNIEATDHRGVLHGASDSLIDNFYGIVTTDNSNSSSPSNTGIVTPIDSNQNYGLDITKKR